MWSGLCGGEARAAATERRCAQSNERALDEERGQTERLAPVADVVCALRQADRPRDDEGDDRTEREQRGRGPRAPVAGADQGTGGDDAADDQADVEPALVGGGLEGGGRIEQVDQRDAGQSDDGDCAGNPVADRLAERGIELEHVDLLSVDWIQHVPRPLESPGSGLWRYVESRGRYVSRGSATRKVVPRSGCESTVTAPPWASVTAATIASPRPTPPVSRARVGSAR